MLKERIDSVKAQWVAGQRKTSTPVVVLEAAVLLDAEWDDMLDGIWVVTTTKPIALKRLMETRGLEEAEAEKRITAQESRRGIGNLDQELRDGVVTGVIENEGSMDDLTKALGIALQDPTSWKN